MLAWAESSDSKRKRKEKKRMGWDGNVLPTCPSFLLLLLLLLLLHHDVFLKDGRGWVLYSTLKVSEMIIDN